MQNMIKRTYSHVVEQRLAEYPAVALVGPRQSGKTTLARNLGGHYFDLEQQADRVSLDLRWQNLVDGDRLIILDEAQEWPELFKRLRGEIDRRRKHYGRFLLLGSVSPALMKHVSESLAGRMSLVELTPFLWSELPAGKRKSLWLSGRRYTASWCVSAMASRLYPTAHNPRSAHVGTCRQAATHAAAFQGARGRARPNAQRLTDSQEP